MFSYASLEERVPSSHSLPRMRLLVDSILRSLSHEFIARYAERH